jgi:DNA-binding response OmpR family regulator
MENDTRKTILCVDDVTFNLLTVKEYLKESFEVFTAQSVPKMFQLLEQFAARRRPYPDLILLDLNMPDVSGFEAIDKLKADARYAEIPVVFLSGQCDKASVIDGLKRGAAAYVAKPYTMSSLMDAIEPVLLGVPVQAECSKDEEEKSDKPCILAVDDFSVMLRTIHETLKDKYKVYTLSKPEKLKAILQDVKPDLFLLDYNMPQVNGFDLVPVIRSFPEHQETPIIFLTAEGTTEQVTTAIQLGACDFIVKPFDVKSLREKIETYLNRGDGAT